jgi:hypothetical protein
MGWVSLANILLLLLIEPTFYIVPYGSGFELPNLSPWFVGWKEVRVVLSGSPKK